MVAASEFSDGATGAGLVSGFRDSGWLVQKVDRGDFAITARLLPIRIASRLAREALQQAYRDEVWRQCQALRPDVFLTVKGTGLDAHLLRRIRDLGTRVVMYYPDFHFEHEGVDPSSFDLYDLFVTTKSFQVGWLGQRLGSDRVAYVPHGYGEQVFQPLFESLSDEEFTFDVLYMGNHSPYKQRWLDRLVDLSPTLRLGVVGNRWREQVVPLNVPQSAMLGGVTGLRLSSLIQRSRINIGLHFGKNNSGWEDLVSTRTFEIPACKGFMLHIDNEEVRSLFEVGEEIDVFRSPEELHEKICFYLDQPVRRAEMAARAYARAVPNYGYASRAREIHRLIVRAGWVPGVTE